MSCVPVTQGGMLQVPVEDKLNWLSTTAKCLSKTVDFLRCSISRLFSWDSQKLLSWQI